MWDEKQAKQSNQFLSKRTICLLPSAVSGPSGFLACRYTIRKLHVFKLPQDTALCEKVRTCMTTLGGMRKLTSASSFEDEDEDESSFPGSPSAGNESFNFSDLNVAAASWKMVSSPCCRKTACLRIANHAGCPEPLQQDRHPTPLMKWKSKQAVPHQTPTG